MLSLEKTIQWPIKNEADFTYSEALSPYTQRDSLCGVAGDCSLDLVVGNGRYTTLSHTTPATNVVRR